MTQNASRVSSSTDYNKRVRAEHMNPTSTRKSNSIISKGGQISSIMNGDVKETEYGSIGARYLGGNFEVFIEVVMEKANTGLKEAGGNLLIYLMNGALAIEESLEDNTSRNTQLLPGQMYLIECGTRFSISGINWSEYLRIQDPGFEAASKQLTAPVDVPEEVAEQRNRIVVQQVTGQRIVNQNKTRNIAQVLAAERLARKNRNGKIDVVQVNAAGVPIR